MAQLTLLVHENKNKRYIHDYDQLQIYRSRLM